MSRQSVCLAKWAMRRGRLGVVCGTLVRLSRSPLCCDLATSTRRAGHVTSNMVRNHWPTASTNGNKVSTFAPLQRESTHKTTVAPLAVDTTSTATELDTNCALPLDFTEIHICAVIQDGLSRDLASKVAKTFVQQNLLHAGARVDEEPARGQGKRALRAPQQNSIGRTLWTRPATSGWLIAKHPRHDTVTSTWCSFSPNQRLNEQDPLLRTRHAVDTRAWHQTVKVTQRHCQESRCPCHSTVTRRSSICRRHDCRDFRSCCLASSGRVPCVRVNQQRVVGLTKSLVTLLDKWKD